MFIFTKPTDYAIREVEHHSLDAHVENKFITNYIKQNTFLDNFTLFNQLSENYSHYLSLNC